jgi:hypothetical protein
MALASGVAGRTPAETNAVREEKIARNLSPHLVNPAASRSQMMQLCMIACNIGVVAIKAAGIVSMKSC